MAFSPASVSHISTPAAHLSVYIKRKYGYEIQLEKPTFSCNTNVHLRKPNVDHIVVSIPDGADILETIEVAIKEREGRQGNEPVTDTAEIIEELWARYPGHSHEIREHIFLAAKQLKDGQVIGNRQTPVISFWLMKPKWKDRGYAWKVLGTDGDFGDGQVPAYPSILRLVYFRTHENLVCQLAYVIKPAKNVGHIDYEAARSALPQVIDQTYEIKEAEHAEHFEDASDEILRTMEKFI